MTSNKYIPSTIGLKYNLLQKMLPILTKYLLNTLRKQADHVGDPYSYENDPKAGKTTRMGS